MSKVQFALMVFAFWIGYGTGSAASSDDAMGFVVGGIAAVITVVFVAWLVLEGLSA